MNKFLAISLVTSVLSALSPSCDPPNDPPKSASGVSKASVQVPTGADGLTAEQRNIKTRLLRDNEPGAVKHLYVISAYSGQTLIYSTVKGKVTSGSKRLTPSTINGGYSSGNGWYGGFPVNIGGQGTYTNEVLGDDGAYGSSSEYLFWEDTKGVYHQHYVQGGQIVHIASEPLSVKSVVINMEVSGKVETMNQEDALPHPTPVKETVITHKGK